MASGLAIDETMTVTFIHVALFGAIITIATPEALVEGGPTSAYR